MTREEAAAVSAGARIFWCHRAMWRAATITALGEHTATITTHDDVVIENIPLHEIHAALPEFMRAHFDESLL